MKFKALIIPVLLSLSAAGVHAADKTDFQRTGLKAVQTLFLDRDVKAGREFFAEDSVRRNGKPGSALRMVEKEIPSMPGSDVLSLSSVDFFAAPDIAAMRQVYGDAGFLKPDRIPANIGNGIGMVVRFILIRKDKTETVNIFFILKEVNGKILITYTDDD